MRVVLSFITLLFFSYANQSSAQLPPTIDLRNFSEDVRISAPEEDLLFGSALATGDFNGDGYDDILIGAYGANNGVGQPSGYQYGRAYIIFGGIQAPPVFEISRPSDSVTIIQGDDAFDLTGGRVASGDVNGDGIDDAVIGANQLWHPTGKGKVYIIYGRRTWPQYIDLNTDGKPLSGVSRIVGRNPQNFLGISLAIGDVNGDGFADVVTGAFGAGGPGDEGRVGEVYVVYGSTDLPLLVDLKTDAHLVTTIVGRPEGRIGEFLGCVDINNDGFADLLIGDPVFPRGTDYRTGKAFIIYGREQLPSVIDLASENQTIPGHGISEIIGEEAWDYFGWWFAGGDVNGDGFTDLLIGTRDWIRDASWDKGKMYVLFGPSEFPAVVDLRNYDRMLKIVGTGADAGGGLGMNVAAGDLNDDGYADIVVGAHYTTVKGMREGKAFIIYGSSSLPISLEINAQSRQANFTQILGYQDNQGLGKALAIGDFNGDGVGDVVVSADETETSAASSLAGEVYVIYGRKGESSSSPPEIEQLLPNYPNPFNSSTIIPYSLKKSQSVSLKIYNSTGQEIRTLVSGWMEAGQHRALWNGYDSHFHIVGNGIYFIKLTGETFSQTHKLLLLR